MIMNKRISIIVAISIFITSIALLIASIVLLMAWLNPPSREVAGNTQSIVADVGSGDQPSDRPDEPVVTSTPTVQSSPGASRPESTSVNSPAIITRPSIPVQPASTPRVDIIPSTSIPRPSSSQPETVYILPSQITSSRPDPPVSSRPSDNTFDRWGLSYAPSPFVFYEDHDIHFTMKKTIFSKRPSVMEVRFYNDSSLDVYYGNHFYLEMNQNGKWYFVLPQLRGIPSLEADKLIPTKGSYTENVFLGNYYSDLPKGQYRLVKLVRPLYELPHYINIRQSRAIFLYETFKIE